MTERKPPKSTKEHIHRQAVRLIVLKRDSNQCQNCGKLKNLCVHHLSYKHQGNELDHLEDLVTLCRSCHGKVGSDTEVVVRLKFRPARRCSHE